MINLLVKNWKLSVWGSLFHFFHVICKISNVNMCTAKHLAWASCTELTLYSMKTVRWMKPFLVFFSLICSLCESLATTIQFHQHYRGATINFSQARPKINKAFWFWRRRFMPSKSRNSSNKITNTWIQISFPNWNGSNNF